jgi:hypothetical protein
MAEAARAVGGERAQAALTQKVGQSAVGEAEWRQHTKPDRIAGEPEATTACHSSGSGYHINPYIFIG